MVTTGLLLALLIICLFWAFFKWGVGVDRSGRRSMEYALPANAPLFRGPSRRRTERLSLAVPIRVTGTDMKGEAFDEETRTKQLSGYGASIILSRLLQAGQEIIISRDNPARSAACRVAYELSRSEEEKHVYGVAFVDPRVDLWGVCNLLTEALAAPKPATGPS